MYQAFRCGLIWPLAGMEMRGPGADHLSELCSLDFIAFPGPDLTDRLTLPFVDLLMRPTFPRLRRPIVDQNIAAAGTRKSSPFVSMAQIERAILLASAIATSILGLRANMRCSQLPSGTPFLKAERTTAIAPMISRRRMSRWPIFEIFLRTFFSDWGL